MKLDKIDKFFSETVRIHSLSYVLVYCNPEILLPWQRDVTTSPLYLVYSLSHLSTAFAKLFQPTTHSI